SYTLYCGIFRMVCSNGMIAGSVDQAIRIRHQGADVPGAVVNASNQIMSRVNDVQSAIENWQGVTIDARAEEIFQDRVSDIIDPDGSRGVRDLKRYLTRARRQSDTAPTLWNIYNRAQENVMNGMYYIPNNSPHRRRGLRSARRITSIDANIKFNAALWDLASNFQAQLVNAN
ncbi:MAG: DUF932 domain-containing protein, partial [Actinobacteria bacterium]|nr:DUF932 domain-containing protein [Actinomycetota bacterium]